MRFPRTVLSIASLAALLSLGACGSGSAASDTEPAPAATETSSSSDVEAALESQTPTGTVEVPSADGATTIAEYSQGSSGYESPAPEELAQILAIVGTDADGYLAGDAVVVQASEADATLWCKTAEIAGYETLTLIPVLADGVGVDCG